MTHLDKCDTLVAWTNGSGYMAGNMRKIAEGVYLFIEIPKTEDEDEEDEA